MPKKKSILKNKRKKEVASFKTEEKKQAIAESQVQPMQEKIPEKTLISPEIPKSAEISEIIKTSENTEAPSNETKESDRLFSKQLYWTFGVMALLVVVFLIAYQSFASLNKIEYNGLTFTKEKFGEIPVFHHYYYINPEIKYNLYVRNDPRKNNVPLTGNAVSTPIEFFQGNPIYISLSPEGLVGCEYSAVGISNLASFFVDNQLKVKSATTDREEAKINKVEYATCDDNPGGVVVILKGGNETQILHEKRDCYIIEIANCEVLPAIEKFQVQSILDAKARREAL